MSRRRRELRRGAAIAWGIGLIALVFIVETALAHQSRPSTASPWIWGALGVVAVIAFARGAWLTAKSRREQD